MSRRLERVVPIRRKTNKEETKERKRVGVNAGNNITKGVIATMD
jgi:hypothetical protein